MLEGLLMVIPVEAEAELGGADGTMTMTSHWMVPAIQNQSQSIES